MADKDKNPFTKKDTDDTEKKSQIPAEKGGSSDESAKDDKKPAGPSADKKEKGPPFKKGGSDSEDKDPKDGGKKPNPFGSGDDKGDEEKKDAPAPGSSGTGTGSDKNIEHKEKAKVNLEPKYDDAPIKEDLLDMFDGDLSDLEEHRELVEEYRAEVGDLSEALSLSARLKRRATMRRFKQRLKISRERALVRRATIDQITKRARRSAISTLKARFSGGRPTDELSNSEKQRVERQVHTRKNSVVRLTRKLIRGKRDLERDRLR